MLVLVTAAIYAQVAGFPFIALDDDVYVTENPTVRAGLTAAGVRWAFTTFHAANWHPLTWISHMLDVQVFGVQAGGAHATSLALHALNAVAAFLVFRRMTGALGRSAALAALFAVHPMHVESVAWIAERKDVLSTTFWLLTMAAYVRYVKSGAAGEDVAGSMARRDPSTRPAPGASSKRWLALACLFLALGLMAKPMLVTVPFVLLLLDVWPLGRLPWARPDGPGRAIASAWPLVREKLPMFGLVLGSCVVTFVAQRAGGAVQELQNVPVSYRLSNSAIAVVRYLAALLWPRDMGVYYPFPMAGYPIWQAAAALLLLIAISVAVWRLAGRFPYLATGWLWYLATLVPVIGLVQVGGQAMADRYTYVPYFGVFLMLVWGAGDFLGRARVPATGRAAIAVFPVAVLGLLAWRQAGLWRDSVTLFTHTLSVTYDNAVIEHNLGLVLAKDGRSDEAADHFTRAVRIWPGFYDAMFNMAVTLDGQGKLDEAAAWYVRALAARPDSGQAEGNLGAVLAQQGRLDDALPHFEHAEQLDPTSAEAQNNLGLALLRQGRSAEALDHLRRAVQLDPRSPQALNNLGLALLVGGDPREAASRFEDALRLAPDYPEARENLRRARTAMP